MHLKENVLAIVTAFVFGLALLQPQDLDGALRKIATTQAGSWLLVTTAAGPITFGAYSSCDARRRKFQPG